MLGVRSRVRAVQDRLGHSRRQKKWARAYAAGHNRAVPLQCLSGTVDETAIPVVMCLWNRPGRIDGILAQLDAQAASRPIRLVLWNNQLDDDAHYREAIASFRATGALASVEYHATGVNVGGIARFFAVKQLVRDGYSGPFIMLDDDQDVSERFVQDLVDAYSPHTYAGWWAFVNHGSYGDRTEALAGEEATYVGSGGAICDSDIVRSRDFFRRLPLQYAFIEDLWASAWAIHHGWRVTKVDTEITFVLEELNQFGQILHLKLEFFDYLATFRFPRTTSRR